MRSLQILSTLFWRESLSCLRDRWYIFLFVAQGILWALMARSVSDSSTDALLTGRRTADMGLMAQMLTAIVAGLACARDRENGILKGMVAAPVSRSLIALGLVIPGSTLALIMGLIPFLFGRPESFASILIPFALLSLDITALLVWLAISMQSVEAYLVAVQGLFLLLIAAIGIAPAGWQLWNPALYALQLLRNSINGNFIPSSALVYLVGIALLWFCLIRYRLEIEGFCKR